MAQPKLAQLARACFAYLKLFYPALVQIKDSGNLLVSQPTEEAQQSPMAPGTSRAPHASHTGTISRRAGSMNEGLPVRGESPPLRERASIPAYADLLVVVDESVMTPAGHAPLAVRAVKEVAQASLDEPLDQALRFGSTLRWIIGQTDDAKEGPRAFAERREALYKGQ